MFRKKKLSIVSLELNRCAEGISRIILVDAVRKGVDAKVNLAPSPVFVMGDCVAVQQIILNLVNNGMDSLQKVMPEARRLSVSVRACPQEQVGSIVVEDNGTGVAEQDREKLFAPFFTTKEEGLGLGLAVCNSLVEALGGRIALVNRGGPGAVFQVDLPLAAG
jgi:C4-dicarboxylate-specific signal transduction histidine kinase